MGLMLLAALDHTIVVTALPLILGDLGDEGALTAVVTAYMIASALAAMCFGQLADITGRKAALFVAVFIFVGASAGCGLAENLPELIALRALQGIGAGGFLTLSQTVIADRVAPRERGRFQGYVLTVWGLASVAGPFVGGALADAVSWRAIFLVNVPVGLAAFIVLRVGLRGESFRRLGQRTSIAGSALVGGAGVCGLLALTILGQGDVPTAVVFAVACGALFAAFSHAESRSRFPVFKSPALRGRVYRVSNTGGCLISAAMTGAVVLVPLYMQRVLGMSAAESGLALLPQLLSWLSATVVCGILISRTGRVKVFAVIGSALTSAGLVLLSQLSTLTPLLAVCGCLLVFGSGLGFVLQSFAVASQAEVPLEEMGRATGLASFVRSVGSVFGVAYSGLIVSLLVQRGADLGVAFQWAMGAATPLGIASVVCAVVMPEAELKDSAASIPH
ncbi:MDR family MFS transporter [Sinomonas sp. G460-2]|uniref:MDR family MFS transporter n=1 Tax=Sinomonas sp. G460-2 TaxID=3393464 RepID=UPI0039EF2DD9